MTGLHHLYVETHNWGKSVAFWQSLGFRLDEQLERSAILRCGDGPYVYLAEVDPAREPVMEVYVSVPEARAFSPGSAVQVTRPFAKTHWGANVMEVRDPDGRVLKVEAAA
jgi:catechol 2,3-dioxygenase-like lactoylglutathione lyase family enzyme